MSDGRVFLLTGVTGFLGKVLLEELIRRREELRVEKVYVLIRSRGSHKAPDRFQREVVRSPCFGALPAEWTCQVEVLEGTLEQPCLGLAEMHETLSREVTHVIHAAASVSFELPIADAARSNILTALNVLDLAKGFRRLERMVWVSTAYVTPHAGGTTAVEEALAPLPAPAAELFESIRSKKASEEELLRASGHPNTYTLTKSIAEHLLMERRGQVPLTIVRPSVISASVIHPFPGWIDSTTGFGAFVLLLGLGHLRAVVGKGHSKLDLIPVDEVASRVLSACDAPPGSPSAMIRHATAGQALSPTILDCWDGISEFYRTNLVARRPTVQYLGPRNTGFYVAEALYHRLPIALASVRSKEMRRKAKSLRTRLGHINRAFPYFTSHSFDFHSSEPLDHGFEPRRYIRTVCRGVHRHLLRGDQTQWVMAGRKHPGHEGDLRWSMKQPHGNLWTRFASWVVTKVLRRSTERVTVDIPSFEAALGSREPGDALVLVPNHRSYLDFVLCSYLAFARPDLGISIPFIAATMEFGRIPVLGRILTALHAFYLRRGTGKEDPELTRRVHQLLSDGKTLEFFIEGERSRTRQFLPPKRGLLRCLQSTGKRVVILPVALSYDRIPEERTFAKELSGRPKPRMKLSGLLRWAGRVWTGRVDLGRIHIACGTPVRLTGASDVHEVSQEIIQRLREATVTTTYHLEAYLLHHPQKGFDPKSLRKAIEERGGRVLESGLEPPNDLDIRIAASLRQQFDHVLAGAAPGAEGNGAGSHAPLSAPHSAREPEPVA
jgi:fatty acyl-CoA reductase